MTFKVRLTREAEADLEHLFDDVLQRERARDSGHLSLALHAVPSIRGAYPQAQAQAAAKTQALTAETKRRTGAIGLLARAAP